MNSEDNIDGNDLSIEQIRELLGGAMDSLFDDDDIKSSIEHSENIIKKNIDELINQFSNIKTDINFVNKSKNEDPKYAHNGDSGFDLRANLVDGESEVTLKSFERLIIPTGLYFEIPKGYDMEVKSRSGLAVRYGISVLTGTIDQNYRGEIRVLLFNTGKEDFVIKQGDRIAQAVIRPIITNESGNLTKVHSLEESNRMDNGFGSTGIN